MRTVALGDVGRFVRGVTFKPSNVADHGIGVMRTKNVQRNLELSDILRIPADLIKRSDQYLRYGDTLVSTANSWNMVGKACWVPEPTEPLAIGGFVSAFRPDHSKVDPRYLYRWFTSGNTQALLRSFSNQTTSIANLNLTRAGALELPLPPIYEQRRIAEILDAADGLRCKRGQVQIHLEALEKSVFESMFGNPLSRDHRYPSGKIGSIAKVVTGNSPSRADPENFGSEIEWIKSGDLGGHTAEAAEERLSARGRAVSRVAPAGSVLVTCIAGSRNSIGKASLVDRDVAFNQQINAILPSVEINSTFLLLQLKVAPELVREKSTGGMKGLVSKSSFERIELIVPPLDAQREFATRIDRINSHRASIGQAMAHDSKLFESLEVRAFRGEL